MTTSDDFRIEPKYYLGVSTQPLGEYSKVGKAVYDHVKRVASKNSAYRDYSTPAGAWWECLFLVGIKVESSDDPRLEYLNSSEAGQGENDDDE